MAFEHVSDFLLQFLHSREHYKLNKITGVNVDLMARIICIVVVTHVHIVVNTHCKKKSIPSITGSVNR